VQRKLRQRVLDGHGPDAELAGNDYGSRLWSRVVTKRVADNKSADQQLAKNEPAETKDEQQSERLHAQEWITEPIPFLAFGQQNLPRTHGDGQHVEISGSCLQWRQGSWKHPRESPYEDSRLSRRPYYAERSRYRS